MVYFIMFRLSVTDNLNVITIVEKYYLRDVAFILKKSIMTSYKGFIYHFKEYA